MPPKYKPGGRSFPPKIKQTSFPPQAPTQTPGSSSSSSSSNVLDSEAEDQFETELCWCIQQLEIALNSGKLSERQNIDTNKTLNVLKSNNAPLIKKRQFMRTTFGDYRTKMNNDTKKLAKITAQVKFHSTNIEGNKKSIFFKKANTTILNTTDKNPGGDNSFMFNFKQPDNNDDSNCIKN